jgi:hypothetical protein
MKPSALRIERLLAKVEAELACSVRPRRYVFHYDEIAEAEAQGLPYVLASRVLSRQNGSSGMQGNKAEAALFCWPRFDLGRECEIVDQCRATFKPHCSLHQGRG